ncbi:STAS domain-containing protein [Brevibacillus sp. TJ4]|uniref:STAS domain-containing protein n=1 Tax=Brevibacillus sp. TJ4 TaxID=3234853 RepID=UPI003BA334F4
MDLTIETIKEEAGYLVVLCGEVDAFTGPQAKEALLALAIEPGVKQIAVDLAQVDYMDSTGIGIFIAAMKACKNSGSQLRVRNLSPRVERLFRITGFYDLIAV